MARMQNVFNKFLLLTGLLLASFQLVAQVSNPNANLQLADSLFAQEKYTESLELYENILNQGQLYTPGMLMKMAFIKEGLGNYSEALFLLNLFYAKTSDKRALRKMEELARQHNLDGYQFNDMEFFRTVYKRYHFHIVGGLVAFALFIFTLILYQKRQRHHRPVTAGILFVIILAALFGLINFGEGRNRAVVLTDQAYLRVGPSSGANVAEIINKGHRVEVVGQKDVWVLINWNNRPLYIRESHLGIIES
jgi:tetratricopeptide (TPR) repeat protein